MFDVRYEERTSAKTGKRYSVLVITFASGYEKIVFLDAAEVALAKLSCR